MRKLLFTLFATSLLFAFSACSDDDNKEQFFFNGDCKQTISLESGPAGSVITTTPLSTTLDDMLKDSEGFGAPVSTGEMLVAGSNTSVLIKNLPAGVVLKDLKININGIERSFGDISNEKANLNLYMGAESAAFFSKAFDKVVSNKAMTTKVTFTPSEKTAGDVTLEIVFSGRFSYWAKI